MISRRKLLAGAAVAPVAALPLVTQDSEEQQLLEAWRMLPDPVRALAHQVIRRFARLPNDPALRARIDAGHIA